MTRALRRHHEQRRKAAVRRRLLRTHGDWITDATVGHWTSCRKPCSCPSCGNGRKWFGHTTLQEQRNSDPIVYDAEQERFDRDDVELIPDEPKGLAWVA